MTHTPKIGDENPYQETGAINWHESIGYHVLFVTENRYQKNGTELHVRRAGSRYTGFPVPVFGAKCG